MVYENSQFASTARAVPPLAGTQLSPHDGGLLLLFPDLVAYYLQEQHTQRSVNLDCHGVLCLWLAIDYGSKLMGQPGSLCSQLQKILLQAQKNIPRRLSSPRGKRFLVSMVSNG